MGTLSGTSDLRDLQRHIEAVVLLFMRLFCADGAAPVRAGYRSSHLPAIAQSLFVLQVVQGKLGGSPGANVCQQGADAMRSEHGYVCTERDLYYRNPQLFAPHGQRAAHLSVERACRWLEVMRQSLLQRSKGIHEPALEPLFRSVGRVRQRLWTDVVSTANESPPSPLYTRESIGVIAAGKSLLAGALWMELCNPTEYLDVSECGSAGVALTYPLVTRIVRCGSKGSDSGTAMLPSALVLIEKESIFQTVVRSIAKGDSSLTRSYALLCTKGYPCVASQQWLRRVHALWPSLELYVLVDGDPHGLCIALTAMGLFGSQGCGSSSHSDGSKAASIFLPATGKAGVLRLLPFRFLGVLNSLLFIPPGARGRDPCAVLERTPALAEGTGISSRDDTRVLQRIVVKVKAALAELSDSTTCIEFRKDRCTQVLQHSLQCILREAEWMTRARIKCELQLACRWAGPLSFMESQVQRYATELSG